MLAVFDPFLVENKVGSLPRVETPYFTSYALAPTQRHTYTQQFAGSGTCSQTFKA